MTVNSFKKPISSTKMDGFVPSLDYSSHFSTSSPSSIYDHDRSLHNSVCGLSMFSNPSIDSEELYGLDDNMEDGSLQTYLTPDVMNSFNQVTTWNSPSDVSWAGKLTHDVSLPAVSDSLSPNPTLAQLDMDSDISFVNDIINADQDDSKLNYSVIDLLCSGDFNDVNNQLFCTSGSCNSPGSVVSFLSAIADSRKNYDADKSSNDASIDKKISTDVNKSNDQTTIIPSSDPWREPKSHLIGVATMIKPEVKESFTGTNDADDNLTKLKTQSPYFYKLFSDKDPLLQIKTEISAKDVSGEDFAIKLPKDISAQIVPTSSTSKRTHAGIIKTEPMSPKADPKSVTTTESMEEKWKDVEHFMHSPGEHPRKKARCESGSSEQISDDDDDDNDDDSSYGGRGAYADSDDDYSDIDADLAHISPSECESLVAAGKKQKQYFWQYNVQSKGPKGTRLKLSVESPSDPHVLNDFEDPVFDECNTAIAGIRHGGKARKGDGNEITPNPRKLFMIGHQLLRLNRQINACQLGSDVPAAKRNESRKEKNKLASRACRLKKKAQHEANKIKLYGLEQEHSQLNSILKFIWPRIREKTKVLMGQTDKSALSSTSSTLTAMLESSVKENLSGLIAGHTTEFVNSVIVKVESGDNCGGLNIKRNHKT